MQQINHNSLGMAPRPGIPIKGLPSMPALNRPGTKPVYHQAPPVVPEPLSQNIPVGTPPGMSGAYLPPNNAQVTMGIASPGQENPGKANSPPKASRSKPAAATSSRKRKSDVAAETKEDLFPEGVEDIDDEDPRLDRLDSDTCNAIRRKIRSWIESGAQKVGEFQQTIGVSSKAYTSFMNRTGTWDGEGCDTYLKAHLFFKRREVQGLPIKASKAKKAKTAASSKAMDEALDVSGVELPGEADGAVPIYDTCDEVRKKTRALLAKDAMTQAAFIREINKGLPDGRSVSPANLRYFMGRRGVRDGNTNVSFYAAYVFFDKKRVKAGKPKTKFRQEMEKSWGPKGFDTEHGANAHFTCFGDEVPELDKYGQINFVRGPPRR
ncbi:hypothetical protein FZEAL_7948 [Fusarium zealandicum]|uniref:DUF7726 domain-containing protein n=1 Tax=Fusarium zealandicum TaxID=1053134 RepID=A0A8H4UF37_9HYPO|nr:hypothetical protein FZEAL_7948 [Fusarium zealandicum]